MRESKRQVAVVKDHPMSKGNDTSLIRLFALCNHCLQIRHHVAHCRTFSRILMPHPLHQINRFRPPGFTQPSDRWSFQSLTDRVVDVMLIMAFPRVLLHLVSSIFDTYPPSMMHTPHLAEPNSPFHSFPNPKASPNKPYQQKTHPPCNRTSAEDATVPALAN